MNLYSAPGAGRYRCVRGVRVLLEQDGGLAICDYPLRAVRLSLVAARLLAYCHQDSTGEELARHTQLPLKRVEALCEQLCRKGLLEAGPALPPATWPYVSIIIPSRNRAAQLERCLRSLLALDYPAPALEVIIVDDASTDETQAMLQRFAEETVGHGWRIQVIRHAAQQGVGKGRNTGAAAASHDLLAYIDSDCVASPGWLKELVPAFQDSRTGAVGGLLRAYERESLVGRYEDVRSSLFMGLRAQEVQTEGPISYVPAANMLVRRQAWQQLEGFAPLNFGEDVDFCRRLLAAGYRVRYLPYGTVYHDYRTRLRDFLRTRISYASSEAVLLRLHPHERRTLLLPPEQATFAALAIGGLWGILARPFQNRGNDECEQPERLAMFCRDKGRMWGWVGALCLSAFRGVLMAYRDGDRHKALSPTRPHPLSLQDGSPPDLDSSWDEDRHKAPSSTRPHPLSLQDGSLFMPDHDCRYFSSTVKGTGADQSAVRRMNSAPTGLIRFPYFLFILAMILTLGGAYGRWRKVREQRVPVGLFAVGRATLRAHLAYTYHLCRHLTRYYTLSMLLAGLALPPLLPFALLLCAVVIGLDYARLRPGMSLGEYVLCSLLDDCAYGVGVILGCIKYRTWKPLVPVIKHKKR